MVFGANSWKKLDIFCGSFVCRLAKFMFFFFAKIQVVLWWDPYFMVYEMNPQKTWVSSQFHPLFLVYPTNSGWPFFCSKKSRWGLSEPLPVGILKVARKGGWKSIFQRLSAAGAATVVKICSKLWVCFSLPPVIGGWLGTSQKNTVIWRIFFQQKIRNLKKWYVSELVYDGKIMIDWSFGTLILGAGFKYLFSPRKLGKMNPFWRACFSDFFKTANWKKTVCSEANAEIEPSQEVQKVAWEWGCSDRHIGALFGPVKYDLSGLPETQESYCQSCYDMQLNVYRWEYIYTQYISI